ncbi:MAG: hypothetical protein D6775_14965 [Caldilineae bacterium]|nr:MAG: hypothetical protein D6775_14965 [Caldilineae bacterium]
MTRMWGEATVIKIAFAGSAVGFLLMLLPGHMAGVIITTGLFMVFNALLRPAVSSLISIRASGGQGVAMGLNNSFMSLGRIVGPVWAGALFDTDLHFPYVSGAIIMLVGFVACLIWLHGEHPAAESPA